MLVAAAGPISNMLLAIGLHLFVDRKTVSTNAGQPRLKGYRQVGDGNGLPPVNCFRVLRDHHQRGSGGVQPHTDSPLMVLGGNFRLVTEPRLSGAFNQLQSYGFIVLIGLLYLGVPSMFTLRPTGCPSSMTQNCRGQHATNRKAASRSSCRRLRTGYACRISTNVFTALSIGML
jgi:hypothetical protein